MKLNLTNLLNSGRITQEFRSTYVVISAMNICQNILTFGPVSFDVYFEVITLHLVFGERRAKTFIQISPGGPNFCSNPATDTLDPPDRGYLQTLKLTTELLQHRVGLQAANII
jgi:hypothetical protein